MKEKAKPQNTIESPEKTPFFKKEGESETSVMKSPASFFTANGIQAKLTVGQPGDRFEQQANRVADKVVNGHNLAINRKSNGQGTQLHEEDGVHLQEEEEELQMQEGEEEVQMQKEEEEPIQMQEEEELVQPREEEEEVQTQEEEEEQVQQQEEEEEPIQMQEEEELVQPQEEEEVQTQEEEEEPIQMQEEDELQMKSGNGKPRMSDDLSQQISSAAGRGSSLPASTQSEMSDSIGYDFSDVKVHTGPESVQMNKAMGAQAFTHGNDVFFNSGKFNPESTNGKHLLAHELTHVVQQGKGRVAPHVQGIFGKIKKGLKKVGKAIKGGAKKVFGGIKKGAKAIGKGAKWLGKQIKSGVKAVGKGAKWLFDKIKKGALKVGKGIKKIAGKIWKGLKKAGKWVWNGLKYVGRQLWDKIKAIYHRAKRWITSLPARLKRLVVHLWNGVKSLKPWSLEWWKSLGKADTWKNFGSWLGELVIYALEVGGIGEIYETIADFIKFNTRAMTDDEIKLAKTVFGNSINYNLIRIDEYAVLGPSFSGREYVSFHTINGWGKIDPGTLIHELTHVWQYEKMGAMYMPRALHGNSKPGFYDYGGVPTLIANAGKGMDAFNPEQQGDIMEDYYRITNNIPTKHGSGTKSDLIHYEVYVNEVKSK
jgi:hypothetical protein